MLSVARRRCTSLAAEVAVILGVVWVFIAGEVVGQMDCPMRQLKFAVRLEGTQAMELSLYMKVLLTLKILTVQVRSRF
jgi:hypothetical protein